MGEKKTKVGIVIAAIIVMVVLDIFVVGFLVLRHFNQNKNDKQVAKTTTESIRKKENPKSILDEMEEDKNNYEENKTPSMNIYIVWEGVKMQIPNELGSIVAEELGPVVYIDDVFRMKIVVRDRSYEERMKDPEYEMSGVVEAGGTITQKMQEKMINDRAYAYFVYELEGEKGMAVVTKGVTSDKIIGGQYAIESDTVKEEDLLNTFAKIAETAVATDEANTTSEDLIAMKSEASMGELRSESTMQLKDIKLTHKVIEGYHLEYANTDDKDDEWGRAQEDYMTADKKHIDCDLYGTEYDDAKTEMELLAEIYSEIKKVESTEINGNTIYYVVRRYEDEDWGGKCQKITAACDLKDGGMYKVELFVHGEEKDYNFDYMRPFFEFVE